MARKPRIDEPGAWHHVMHRGARREPIFLVEDHCALFTETLEETVARHGIEVHAYALMNNHYHLLLRSVYGNLSRAMRHLNSVYTLRFNRACGFDGALFRGRFRSQAVKTEAYLRTLLPYIHLNPVRAALVIKPEHHSWSSHRAYVGLEPQPPWLTCDYLLKLYGGVENLQRTVEAHRVRSKEWPDDFVPETGWFRTSQGATCPTLPREDLPPPKPAEPVPEAREVLRHVLAITKAKRKELYLPKRGPRANPPRRFAAWALAKHTALTHTQIAAELRMSIHQLGALLGRLRKGLPAPLDAWDERLSLAIKTTHSAQTPSDN